MKESHDSKWAGHPGIHHTTTLLADKYYWPHMGRDVEAYVKTCLMCKQNKVEAGKPMGLLQPLPIPERPWKSISMDFIIGLPKVDDFSSIMVVVDRFSKYATSIPASKVCPAEEAARLFLKHVVKYWGVLKTIVSDRDTRFTGRFWTELFKLEGSLRLRDGIIQGLQKVLIVETWMANPQFPPHPFKVEITEVCTLLGCHVNSEAEEHQPLWCDPAK
ncbi:hypothetical protein GQ457_12G018750 [Hibiscus cannabinus]